MQNSASVELTGEIAVVTGSSSGIGRAIALELAAGGADVLVHAAKNRAGVDDTANQMRKLGRDTDVLVADFDEPRAVEKFAEGAWNWRGRVDIWVNNAGADTLTGDIGKQSYDEKLRRLWQVDVLATVQLSRAIGNRMLDRGNGTIINIGWDQADIGMEGDSGELFATTKGAVMSFSRSLAKSLAPQVRVNCIAPGWIKTAWGEHVSDEWQERARRESLMQRWGMPEDVARVARFLASPAAAFITGQVLAVNGGRV
jgi:NAD(P)-dependent dehydrogenase (short-subunit alcohol dehydrogenase family)